MMFCHKCGNQLTEGAAFCPKCGTKVNAASEVRAQGAYENNVKPQKTKKSKKFLIFLIVAAAVGAGILIRNATRMKDPITAERFITVMKSKGYTVRDVTDNYADDKALFRCYVASTDYGCDIFFDEYYSDSEAKDRFSSSIVLQKNHAKNYSSTSVYKESGKNYSIYTAYLISSSRANLYTCSVRVGNVYIYAASLDGQKRSDILDDMKSLGLGNLD